MLANLRRGVGRGVRGDLVIQRLDFLKESRSLILASMLHRFLTLQLE